MSSVEPPVSVGVKSVLIAFDFSEASRKPLRHALAIARHYEGEFYLAHVVSSPGFAIAGPESLELAIGAAQRDMQQLKHDLLESGALADLHHEFIVREGKVWEQLELIIRQKQVDLVVIGTHGRRSMGKLLLGSVAEQIFRHADCFVLTVGPGSYQDSPVENPQPVHPFLFATDFGAASLHALPRAISFANQFGAKLFLLHALPTVPIPESFHWSATTGDVMQMRANARVESLRRLEELTLQNPPLAVKAEFMVRFGKPSEQILQAAHALKADLIIMGLNRSAHIYTASHTPWTTAYEVVCAARCPVLTMRN